MQLSLLDAKACTKCGETKPLGEFYKQKSTPDGLQYTCKSCSKKASKRWREHHPDRAAATTKKWQENNREKTREAQKRWRDANGDKNRKRMREYCEKNRKELRERQKKWAQENRDYARKWREANPEKVRELKQRRRARKQANGAFEVTDKDLRRLYASPCAECGSTDDIQADHIIPIAKGGQHSIGNLQPLCRSCNASKSDKLPVEWRRPELGGAA